MKKPLIGITSDVEGSKYVLKTNYVGMVVQAGGLPAMLPPIREVAAEQILRYDGIILTGGDDIDPTEFGEELHPKACVMDARRQAGEFALIEALSARPEIPVLGICLGMQMMGVHAGGKLAQHLPDMIANGDIHIGNQVHRISGGEFDGEVTSQHHQGLLDAGRLRVVAKAPDGVIEAIDDKARAFYLGVQWHPERTADPALGLGLFKKLILASIKRMEGLLALLLIVLSGCAAPKESEPAPPPEKSVRPGINKPYFEDPKVETWLKRFEIESREIYTDRSKIVDAVQVEPGMFIADVGAGTGFLTRLLAARTGDAGLVYAVDIMPSFLAHIAERAAEERVTNIKFILCKEDSVELPPNSVDLVFSSDTYHHFEYPKSTMASIHRALRPEGILVIVDFIRIEGQSRQWILEHVRAGEEVVRAEIEAAGFEFVSDARFLKENYLLRFRKR